MRYLKKILLFLLLAIISINCFACGTIDYDGSGTIDYDGSAISCAKQLVKEDLKNPSGAVFNEVRIELKDEYHRYIVYVDVSAQIGFGGHERNKYYVGLRLTEDAERFYYSRYLPYINANGTPEGAINVLFKDWGQPPQTE